MSKPDYSVPALEKGLSILEFMAGQTESFSIADLAKALDRSKTEIYRTLITLENRGYIQRAAADGRYEMTGLLFDLGMRHPPRRQLIDVALPHMYALSRAIGQSCHLSVFSGDAVVVVARTQAEAAVGLNVQPGFRAPLPYSTSGRLLYAYQTRHQQAIWLNMLRKDRAERPLVRAFLDDVRTALRQGYLVQASSMTTGITNIAVPVLQARTGLAVASLAVPFVVQRLAPARIEDALPRVQAAAKAIGEEMG